MPDTEVNQKNSTVASSYNKEKYGIGIFDTEFNVEFLNERALELIGRDKIDVEGTVCYSSIIGSAKPCEGCMVSEVITFKETKSTIKHEVTLNGESRDIEQVWIPILDESGEVQ